MSERLPDRPQPRYQFTYGELQFPLTPDVADMYIFTSEPWYDHIYIKLPESDDESLHGVAIWRIDVEHFDDIVDDLCKQGGEPYDDETAPQSDVEYFLRCGKSLPSEYPMQAAEEIEPSGDALEPAPQPELFWISRRNEKIIERTAAFIVYLAERGKLL